MHFKKFFLLYTLVPLLILSAAASYYRFMVIHDYTVEYEGVCEPEVSSCFVGCEDDECSAEYYYTIMTKDASKLTEQCGANITDCESANVCLPSELESCSITYCDTLVDIDACEAIDVSNQFEYSETPPTPDGLSEDQSITELNI